MIKSRTVFVLGAGASIPYGFPSGAELRQEICDQTLKPGDSRHDILMDCKFTFAEVKQFRIALARSWASSIDMFLATRLDCQKVGKAAIALTIAKYEIENNLFFAQPSGDWLRFLWSLLHTPRVDDFPSDRVSFITFNYDRTLEHALLNGLEHAYQLAGSALLARMPRIVHVYGSLGRV